METLIIEPLVDLKELSSFCCGIPQMDHFIHNGFAESVRNAYCKPYVVRNAANEVVAMFALSFDALRLDSDDIEDLQNGWTDTSVPQPTEEYATTYWSKVQYPALEIAYLAVSEKYRDQHIGKYIIEQIASLARTQDLAGCQFLTVGAYVTKEYSAVGFYRKCHFAQAEPFAMHDTLRMYYNLLMDDSNCTN